MLPGCRGCLTGIVLWLAVAGVAVLGYRMLQDHPVETATGSNEDGYEAQRKLLALAQRQRRAHTVALTEAELNAFLQRHLDLRQFAPLRPVGIRLPQRDTLEIVGQVPLDAFVGTTVTGWLPASLTSARISVLVRATPRLETDPAGRGRQNLTLEIAGVVLGRQAIPAVLGVPLLEMVLGQNLKWPISASVEAVTVEPGQVLVRLGPSR